MNTRLTTQNKENEMNKWMKFMKTSSLTAHPFVTCWSSRSSSWAGVGIRSALTSLGVLALVSFSILSVQILAKSQSCFSSIMQLFLCWMQFRLCDHILILFCSESPRRKKQNKSWFSSLFPTHEVWGTWNIFAGVCRQVGVSYINYSQP